MKITLEKTALENLDNALPFEVRQLHFDGNVFKLALVKLADYSDSDFAYVDLEKKYYMSAQFGFNPLEINRLDDTAEFVEWV